MFCSLGSYQIYCKWPSAFSEHQGFSASALLMLGAWSSFVPGSVQCAASVSSIPVCTHWMPVASPPQPLRTSLQMWPSAPGVTKSLPWRITGFYGCLKQKSFGVFFFLHFLPFYNFDKMTFLKMVFFIYFLNSKMHIPFASL